MGQDGASIPGRIRVGPLGCLGLLAVGSAGWAVGRIPDLATRVTRDVAVAGGASAVPPTAAPTPPQLVAAPAAPAPIIITMPAPPPPQVIIVRDGRATEGGGRWVTTASEPAELRWTLPQKDNAASTPAAAADAPKPEPVAQQATTDQAGYTLAAMAYDDLARGDRRGAATKFESALAVAPGAGNAEAWKRELKRLKKRWSVEAYTVLRDDGPAGLATRPLLGGGQAGAQIAYTPMPLARRPLYAVVRTTTANTGGFSRTSGGTPTSQVAAGLKWQVLPQLSVSGERLFALDDGSRDAWTVRLAGGVAHRFGRVLADGYAEAGVVGFAHPDWYAGLQSRAVLPFKFWQWQVEPGVGVWSAVQHGGATVSRVDLGPTVAVTWDRWKVRASADYRLKAAGNARPGSGPAVTISSAF